ncbi:MAG: hypothetical protein U0M06_12800 [Clostridia bacterium]|nr:hypothetical protein [Clostridia bacterium]
MAGMQNTARCDIYKRLTVGGREVLRASADTSSAEPLPDKIKEFYEGLARTAVDGALNILSDRAKSEFANESNKGRGSAFFKRFNYFFVLRTEHIGKDLCRIETEVSLRRGSEMLFEQKKSHVWSLSEGVIVRIKRKRKNSRKNDENHEK